MLSQNIQNAGAHFQQLADQGTSRIVSAQKLREWAAQMKSWAEEARAMEGGSIPLSLQNLEPRDGGDAA